MRKATKAQRILCPGNVAAAHEQSGAKGSKRNPNARRFRAMWQKLPGRHGFPPHDRIVTPLAAPR
jgi:hypothetical protein